VGPGGLLDSRFELESLVGAGGMADVYRARDVTSGSLVAVKVLREVKAGRDARFARESVVLARMLHPHIVRYVAHGRSSDATWMAMEWLDGEVLESRLQKAQPLEPLPPAAGVAPQVQAPELLPPPGAPTVQPPKPEPLGRLRPQVGINPHPLSDQRTLLQIRAMQPPPTRRLKERTLKSPPRAPEVALESSPLPEQALLQVRNWSRPRRRWETLMLSRYATSFRV